MRIVQISDPHFGALQEGTKVPLINKIHELSPDLVMVTGDITQRARREQFEEARGFIESLKPLPVLAVPGNHDIPLFNLLARLVNPFYGYQKYFFNQLEGHFKKDHCEVILLNSANWWRHVDGELDPQHLLEKLNSFGTDSTLRVLAFHHPMDCPSEKDVKNLIHRNQEIARLCADHRVDLILGGHIHDPLVRLSSVRYLGLSRNFIVVVAGTSLSHRTRAHAPNSFNFIEAVGRNTPEEMLRVSRFDFLEGRFTLFRSHEFYKSNSGADWCAR